MPNLIDRKSCNELNNLITSDKRVFLECPDEVPGIEFGEPVQAELERTVVASDFFGNGLPEGQILVQHNCWFQSVKTLLRNIAFRKSYIFTK